MTRPNGPIVSLCNLEVEKVLGEDLSVFWTLLTALTRQQSIDGPLFPASLIAFLFQETHAALAKLAPPGIE